MKEYIISKLANENYDNFLLCLNFESIANYLEEIENDPVINGHTGKMLIDQLLVTGNGENRYIHCRYKNGKLDLSSFENVIPDEHYKCLSVELLKMNYDCVLNSILTDAQRKCVLEGIAF